MAVCNATLMRFDKAAAIAKSFCRAFVRCVCLPPYDFNRTKY
jgi:hypothetical protein